MPARVKLTEDEISRGIDIGRQRIFSAIENKLYDRRTTARHNRSWDVDIEGALGEIAAAKLLRQPLNNIKGEADLGSNIQIRTTKYANGHLLINKGDNPNDIYVLVRGAFGKYEVVGWIYGKDGQQQSNWREEYSAFFVNEDDLLPIYDLPLTS